MRYVTYLAISQPANDWRADWFAEDLCSYVLFMIYVQLLKPQYETDRASFSRKLVEGMDQYEQGCRVGLNHPKG